MSYVSFHVIIFYLNTSVFVNQITFMGIFSCFLFLKWVSFCVFRWVFFFWMVVWQTEGAETLWDKWTSFDKNRNEGQAEFGSQSYLMWGTWMWHSNKHLDFSRTMQNNYLCFQNKDGFGSCVVRFCLVKQLPDKKKQKPTINNPFSCVWVLVSW